MGLFSSESNNVIRCCPCCGCQKINGQSSTVYCTSCKKSVPVYISKQSLWEYKQLVPDWLNADAFWEKYFVEKELSHNPLFDSELYNMRIDIQKASREKQHNEAIKLPPANAPLLYDEAKQRGLNQQGLNQQQNKPKCPTCGSTNVRKISDLKRGAHAVMWGLLSTTAKSQFECKNCGYKW